jgi:hypothetical protein
MKSSKWSKHQTFPLSGLSKGLYKETRVEATRQELHARQIIAVDTGLKRPMTALNVKTGTSYRLRIHDWQHQSGTRSLTKWLSNAHNKPKLAKLSSSHQSSFQRTAISKRHVVYMKEIAKNWTERWLFNRRRKLRQAVFHAHRKKEGAIAQCCNSILALATAGSDAAPATTPIVIIGDGNRGGKYMRIKGRPKAPVQRLQKELAKRALVISSDEFATSQVILFLLFVFLFVFLLSALSDFEAHDLCLFSFCSSSFCSCWGTFKL